MARGNDVACREAGTGSGGHKSILIAASWPSYTLLSMLTHQFFISLPKMVA